MILRRLSSPAAFLVASLCPFAFALAVAGCAHTDAPSGSSAQSTSSTSGEGSDAAVETLRIAPPPDAGAMTAVAVASADAPRQQPTKATGDDATGVDSAVFACHADAECTAVRKNGCCNHGDMEAVNAAQVDAYKASFTCTKHLMCPQFLRRDTRVPVCDTARSRCQMVQPKP